MMAIGLVYRNRFPKDINKLHGYRTTRSMKNQETWDFTQRAFAKVAIIEGTIIIVGDANSQVSKIEDYTIYACPLPWV